MKRLREMQLLKLTTDGVQKVVSRTDYVSAKTKQLREFGYSDLSEKHVDEQVSAVLDGKTLGKGLTVIGMFMKDEIVVEEPVGKQRPNKRSREHGKR
jgi:hypothetical protein